jgi:hypothetical protein
MLPAAGSPRALSGWRSHRPATPGRTGGR